MTKPGTPGEHILLMSHVHDGNGHLIRDALANHEGIYDSDYDSEKAFNSFGRTATSDAGEWALNTIKPGTVKNAAGGPMADHCADSHAFPIPTI